MDKMITSYPFSIYSLFSGHDHIMVYTELQNRLNVLYAVILIFCSFAESGHSGPRATQVLQQSSDLICTKLKLKLEALGCNFSTCHSGKEIEFYTANDTIFKTHVNNSDKVINFNNTRTLYQHEKVSYVCRCEKREKSRGELQLSSLPLPVRKTKLEIYSIGNNAYAANISFHTNERFAKQTYTVTGTQELLGASTVLHHATCSRKFDKIICPRLLEYNINYGYSLRYSVWSANKISVCGSKSWSKEVTAFDLCGPPEIPLIQEIGKDFVKINFTKPWNFCSFVKYQLEICVYGICQTRNIGYRNKKSYKIGKLAPLSVCQIRSRYIDILPRISEWTKPVNFTTLSEVPQRKPQSVTCLPKRVQNKPGFLISWKGPKLSSRYVVNKYIIFFEEASSDYSKEFFPGQKGPPFEYPIQANSSQISVSILACSNGGCPSQSLAEYATCMSAKHASKGKAMADKRSTMYIVIGVCVPIIFVSLVGVALYLGYLFATQRRLRTQLTEGTEDNDQYDFDVVDPINQYERNVGSERNNDYINVFREHNDQVWDTLTNSSESGDNCSLVNL